jgi:hypothetical protein
LKFYRETVDGLEISSDAIERVRTREAQLATSAVAECEFMTKLWHRDVEGARKALLDALDDTVLADAKLAGWYSVWLGASYEAENDGETAIAHYKKARSRLSPRLNVPFKSAFDVRSQAEGEKTLLQTVLLEANHHGPQALGDLIGKLRFRARVLIEGKSSNEKEESLRVFGELLGYTAARPDNEFGSGPDVTWKDSESGYGLAFELKTEKDSPAQYKKKEVGQMHNHIQWLKDNEADTSWDGLLLVGPNGTCNADASPSDNIFLAEHEALAQRMRAFAAKLDDTRGRTALDRWTLLSELGALAEWQLSGWFKALATRRLKDLTHL